MDVFRVSEACNDVHNRETYKLLEKLSTFSLLECRNISELSKMDLASTLALDHFDESSNPSALLNQILNSELDLSTIIVVDRDPNFSTPGMSRLDIKTHIIFNSHYDESLIQRRKEMAA